jgi:antitoxin component YwqK of YwqJK toxin-antitoxin module
MKNFEGTNTLLGLLLFLTVGLGAGRSSFAQSSVTYYHDNEQQVLKETFQVSATDPSVLDGTYVAYYTNGTVKTRGQYTDNQATGRWEYFYENGQPKMRGPLRNNRNAGYWEYFFENGQLQMAGAVYDSTRQGAWQFYYESGQPKQEGSFEAGQRTGVWQEYYEGGALKSQSMHRQDTVYYQGFYASGARQLEGTKVKGRNEGRWKSYYDTGELQAEGAYHNGTRQGPWKFYYQNGKVSSVGDFLDGSSVGKWTYYYENGAVSAEGAERDGVKEGYWKLYHSNGDFKGETIFNRGDGTYREYYDDGALKVKGHIVDGVNQGKWQYFYPDGTLEGECIFADGEGTYFGYYADGSLKMKGTVAQSERTGVWELYEPDGTLVGYYKSVYENNEPQFEALEAYLSEEEKIEDSVGAQNPNYLFRKKKSLRYFEPKINERQRFILGVNPMALLVHRLPLSVEYYLQERLGYELEGGLFRNPFWGRRESFVKNVTYQRGFFVHLRQKFYHPDSRVGMFYFGHQLGFDYLWHYANVAAATPPGGLPPAPQARLLAKEQRLSYSLLLGTRLIKDGDLVNSRIVRDRHARGLTFDLFGGIGVGYRLPHARYASGSLEANIIEEELNRPFVPFYFGATVGYAF